MNTKQIGILNSLVTFAAENIPGDMSEDEHEVARIVARWTLHNAHKTHNYKTVNVSHYKTVEEAANIAAELGWRVAGVISDSRPGYAHSLILERPVGVTHPDD